MIKIVTTPANRRSISHDPTTPDISINNSISKQNEDKSEENNSIDVQQQLQNTKKRNTELIFIKDSKARANARCKRKKGLLNKIKHLDTLTGSSSIFVSRSMYNDKIENITYATKGSDMENLLPKIKSLIHLFILT